MFKDSFTCKHDDLGVMGMLFSVFFLLLKASALLHVSSLQN
ncbi:MAG: hypothetical protein U9N52_09315 [Campylobacterota bacterium]|nr:hypothetical protein [Campylobacterota bacterium]